MTPGRDRLAKILMVTLGIASVGAFANAALEFRGAAADRVTIEVWRMFAFLVFAGLFTLLGLFPRRMTGIWELVFAHKAGVAAFLAYAVKPATGIDGPASEAYTIYVDAALATITLFCYALTNGWRAWVQTNGAVR